MYKIIIANGTVSLKDLASIASIILTDPFDIRVVDIDNKDNIERFKKIDIFYKDYSVLEASVVKNPDSKLRKLDRLEKYKEDIEYQFQKLLRIDGSKVTLTINPHSRNGSVSLRNNLR